ncbi:MAG: hypothetical protein FH748_14720 [Balneolaceae bacterium]|nr:hypothetical protein [Balneolaceae bacterium]
MKAALVNNSEPTREDIMKISNNFLLFLAALIFFGFIGGYSFHIGWGARFFKLALVLGLIALAYQLRKSDHTKIRKGALIIVLLLATGVAWAEPYASDLIFGHHHHHSFCLN